jgi:hypothetical protein
MKKFLAYIMVGAALTVTGCDSLDLSPDSSITDSNYWQSDAQFSAFNIGLHSQFRERSYKFFLLGEPRADYYKGETAFGSATQGNELMWQNNLSAINPGVSNFADLYGLINQVNLMINKGEQNTTLDAKTRNFYLGQAYGMRAYLYLHLLRSWGNVIIWTDYTEGSSLDFSNLNKSASPAADVMQLIIDDVTASEAAFGSNYSFKGGNQRYFWSKAATMMVKAEAYMWRGKHMGGGNADYTTAKNALMDIQASGKFSLLENYTDVFAFDNKNNAEIIFAIRNSREDSFVMWKDNNFTNNMLPQQNLLFSYADENGTPISELGDKVQINGVCRYAINPDLYSKGFHDADTRKRGTLQAAFEKNADTGELTYAGAYPCKYLGTLLAGAAIRSMYDDYPIYRYADCLLLLAQAKAFLGEDPATEINAVRERAYGKEYFKANYATLAYPNDNDPELYTNNSMQKPDNAGAMEAVLKERMREFMVEGKRWYDLRLAGDEYVLAHTTANEARLLWPIDENTLNKNKADDKTGQPGLVQTPGYK